MPAQIALRCRCKDHIHLRPPSFFDIVIQTFVFYQFGTYSDIHPHIFYRYNFWNRTILFLHLYVLKGF